MSLWQQKFCPNTWSLNQNIKDESNFNLDRVAQMIAHHNLKPRSFDANSWIGT